MISLILLEMKNKENEFDIYIYNAINEYNKFYFLYLPLGILS